MVVAERGAVALEVEKALTRRAIGLDMRLNAVISTELWPKFE
jgi:hypothetical protein